MYSPPSIPLGFDSVYSTTMDQKQYFLSHLGIQNVEGQLYALFCAIFFYVILYKGLKHSVFWYLRDPGSNLCAYQGAVIKLWGNQKMWIFLF